MSAARNVPVDAAPGEESPNSDLLSRQELRRRASAGISITASWGVVNLVFGFAGNLVLARLLVPRDFGLVAIGTSLIAFANALSDGGLGGGFLRRQQTPRRAELRTLLGAQLAMTSALALLIAAVAAPFGTVGAIAAVMVSSLPLLAFQAPGRMMLARSLLYQRIALVDVAGLTAYYAWAIGGVVAGFGVWALATGAVVRAAVGSAMIGRVSGLGLFVPSLRGVRALGDILRFGIRFQAVSITMVVRDQALNGVTGLVAGVATLGLWSLISRLMQIPLLFFESLWRVSFPAMSQLLAAKEDPKPAIERGVALSAVAAGLLLASFASAAPDLIPVVFGGQWRDATAVVPWACLALLVSGPISVSTVGYLYAADRPSAVLRASLALALAWLAVTAALLPALGVEALGVGWFAGALADAAVLVLATRSLCDAALVRPLLPTLGAALLAWVAGSGAALLADGLLAGLTGGAVAAAAFLAVSFAARPRLVRDTLGAVVGSVVAALPARPPRASASDATVG